MNNQKRASPTIPAWISLNYSSNAYLTIHLTAMSKSNSPKPKQKAHALLQREAAMRLLLGSTFNKVSAQSLAFGLLLIFTEN